MYVISAYPFISSELLSGITITKLKTCLEKKIFSQNDDLRFHFTSSFFSLFLADSFPLVACSKLSSVGYNLILI